MSKVEVMKTVTLSMYDLNTTLAMASPDTVIGRTVVNAFSKPSYVPWAIPDSMFAYDAAERPRKGSRATTFEGS